MISLQTENIKTVLLKRKSEIKSVQKEGSSQAYNNVRFQSNFLINILFEKLLL